MHFLCARTPWHARQLEVPPGLSRTRLPPPRRDHTPAPPGNHPRKFITVFNEPYLNSPSLNKMEKAVWLVHTVKDMALDAALKVCYMYGILTEGTVTNVSEKFVQSLWLTMVARVAMLMMPFVASFGTWLLWQIYTTTQDALAAQAAAISALQRQVQDHEFRLENEREERLEFQSQTMKQFDVFDQKLQLITDKLGIVNDTMIRVQTIIETRLPPKSASGEKKWSQQ